MWSVEDDGSGLGSEEQGLLVLPVRLGTQIINTLRDQ